MSCSVRWQSDGDPYDWLQVELLLTLEEYCEEAGGDGNAYGGCFEAVFQQVTPPLTPDAPPSPLS